MRPKIEGLWPKWVCVPKWEVILPKPDVLWPNSETSCPIPLMPSKTPILPPNSYPKPLQKTTFAVSQSARFFSSSVTFTTRNSSSENKYPYKLRVPLLKSPSHFGHTSSRVNRLYNEDRYSAGVLSLNDKSVFNFNIFDGHGGDQCSKFLADSLSQTVEARTDLVSSPQEQDHLLKTYAKDIGGYWKRWYKKKEENVARMKSRSCIQHLLHLSLPPDDLSVRIPMAFLATDYDFFRQKDNKSGSTCTSAFIETVYSENESRAVLEEYYFHRKTISKLTVAQVGDTRAILVDRTGEAHGLTSPHHPSNPSESARLRRYSSTYFMTDSFGEERFISLANTRSFGDLNFKEMGVTAEPDVAQYIIGDSETVHKKLSAGEIEEHTVGGLGGDESFLVLCTDGVTNELTDQEIADIIMVNFNLKGHQKATPQFCAEEVIKFVEYIGGDDNATCLVVRLNGWGKWPVKDRTGALRQERLNDYTPRGHD